MSATATQIQDLATQLCGTCGSVEAITDDDPAFSGMDSMDITVRLEQEGEIFLCAGCGWWCENEEMHTETGDQLCGDCSDG